MKLTAPFSLLPTPFTPLTSAGTRILNGDQLETGCVQFHTYRACHRYDGNCGAFQGTCSPTQKKYACIAFVKEQNVGNVGYE
jgi:hypothetical protein